jgi:hypothetical protein
VIPCVPVAWPSVSLSARTVPGVGQADKAEAKTARKKKVTEKASELRAAVRGKAKDAAELTEKANKAAAAERCIAHSAEVVNLEVGHSQNRQGAQFELACLHAVAERYDLLDEEGHVLAGEAVRVLQNVRLARANEVRHPPHALWLETLARCELVPVLRQVEVDPV